MIIGLYVAVGVLLVTVAVLAYRVHNLMLGFDRLEVVVCDNGRRTGNLVGRLDRTETTIKSLLSRLDLPAVDRNGHPLTKGDEVLYCGVIYTVYDIVRCNGSRSVVISTQRGNTAVPTSEVSFYNDAKPVEGD